MELNFLSVFLIMGFVQGVVLVLVAFGHKSMSQFSHKTFGLLLIILSLATLGTFANHELEDFSYPVGLRLFVNYFPYYLIMILGPTIFLHSQSILLRDFKFTRAHQAHFYPAILEFVPFVLSTLTLLGSLLDMIKVPQDGYIDYLWSYQRIMEVPRAISIIVYMILGWQFLRKYKEEAPKQRYQWVKTLLSIYTGLILLFLMDLTIYFSPARSVVFEYPFDIYTIYYPICAFIYFVSFRLLFQKPPWYWSTYEVPGMDEKATRILQAVENESIFKNPNLKLKDIGEATGLSEKAISYVLNHYFNKGFNAFVNELRVKEVIRKINREDISRFTIEGIALSVGFASRATFYRAFKKYTNKLPSDYLASMQVENDLTIKED